MSTSSCRITSHAHVKTNASCCIRVKRLLLFASRNLVSQGELCAIIIYPSRLWDRFSFFFFFSFFVQKDKRSIRVFQSPRITIVLAAAWNLRAFPANEGSSASSTVTTRLMKLNDGAKSARGYADISGKSGLCSATVYQAKSRRRHPPPLKKSCSRRAALGPTENLLRRHRAVAVQGAQAWPDALRRRVCDRRALPVPDAKSRHSRSGPHPLATVRSEKFYLKTMKDF